MEEHKRCNKYRVTYKAYVNKLRKMIFDPWSSIYKGSSRKCFNGF